MIVSKSNSTKEFPLWVPSAAKTIRAFIVFVAHGFGAYFTVVDSMPNYQLLGCYKKHWAEKQMDSTIIAPYLPLWL